MAKAKSKGSKGGAARATTAKGGAASAPKAQAPKRGAIEIDVVPEVVGNQAAYEAYMPRARALTGPIKPFRADASLAYHNVAAGTAAVVGARETIDERVTKTDWAALAHPPNHALAVCYAASVVSNATTPDTGLRGKLAEAAALRRVLLSAARSLRDAGALDAKAVAAIERGSGPRDAAEDCVALAALFTKNAVKLRGKHPVTSAQVTRAAAVGSEVMAALKPKRARGAAKDASADVDARDRLWTLLNQTHTELRRHGLFVWVDDADAHVPVLQASRSLRRAAPPAPPPAPPPAEPLPVDPVDGGAS